MKHLLLLILFWCVLFGCGTDGHKNKSSRDASTPRNGPLGIAITPKNFPSHNPADMDEAFDLAHQLADHAVFIYQWGELDLEVVRLMLSKSVQAGLSPIVGFSPTSLDRGRKELDLPAIVHRQAGNFISFANPVIRSAYRNTVRDLANLRPPYLCLATEINFLALQRLDEFLHFADLYKKAYRDVKRISPGTKVFVSFQWEWMRIIDAREPHKIKEHRKIVDIFRPELDVIGLTSYPAPFHDTPAGLPPDYYSWINHHVQPDDQVVLMELGWPTKAAGDEREQQNFITQIPAFFSQVNVSIVAWSLLHDVDLPAFDANLNSVGLIRSNGQKKKGFDAFKSLRRSLLSKAQ
jgi:hypothetical protein